jgi:hypothetical protein
MQRLLMVLVFLIPFQKRLTKFFRAYCDEIYQLRPELPVFFDHRFGVYVGEVLLLCLIVVTLRKGLKWKAPLSALAVFCGLLISSILFSSTPGYLLHYFKWVHIVCAFFFFYIIVNEEDYVLRKLMFMVVIAGFFQGLIAIAQYSLQDSVGLKMFGELNLEARTPDVALFYMQDGTKWIFEKGEGVAKQIIRASGTLPHANILGGFLVMSTILTYQFASVLKRWLPLVLFVQILAMFLTFSRGAIISWTIASGVWVAFQFLLKGRPWRVASMIVISAGLSFFLLFPQILNRGGLVVATKLSAASDQMRLSYEAIAWSMFKTHPIFGIGFDHFFIELDHYSGGFLAPTLVHNIFLLIGAETGVLGLTAFLSFIGLVIISGWKNRANRRVYAVFPILIAFLLIGCFDFYLVYHLQGWLMLMFVTALLSAPPATKPATV